MPIVGRSTSVTTYEERIARILDILHRMPSSFDAQLIKNMLFELAQRYIDKSKELERYVNPKVEEMDRRFIENIIRDLNLKD